MTHPAELRALAVDMYASGERLKVIEAVTGITDGGIVKIAVRAGLKLRREKGKKESAILSLWQKGLNKAQIARETGYCWLTVHNTIKAAI